MCIKSGVFLFLFVEPNLQKSPHGSSAALQLGLLAQFSSSGRKKKALITATQNTHHVRFDSIHFLQSSRFGNLKQTEMTLLRRSRSRVSCDLTRLKNRTEEARIYSHLQVKMHPVWGACCPGIIQTRKSCLRDSCANALINDYVV